MTGYNIRNRLLVFIISISLIPLVIMGYFGYSSTKELIYEREEEKLQNFFDNIEGKLIKFFCNSEKDLKFLSKVTKQKAQYFDTDLDSRHTNELEKIYYHFSQNNIQYDQIRFINKDGFEAIRINNTDRKAQIVPKDKLQYKGDRYYIKESYNLKDGEVYVTDIDLNREKGSIEKPLKPMVRYVTPVYIKDELKGFVILNLNAKYIFNDIERLQESNKYDDLVITDKNGYYLIHPDKTKEYGSQRDLNTGESLKKDYPTIYNEIINTESLEIRKIESDIIAWDPMKLKCFKDENFVLFIQIEKKDYLAPLIHFRNLFLLVLLGTALLVLIAGNISSNYFTKPILRIVRAVSNIGKGHFDVDIKVSTNDELELLSNEIKKMSHELKNMYINMEDLVDERTKELQDAKIELEEMATKDSLTGLYNRHYFNEYIESLANKVIRENNHLIIVIIDVDKFKYINDTYGHNVGDIVLQDVANILQESSRDSDIVVRYGGDEFLVALYGSNPGLVHKYINRVEGRVDEYNKNNNVLNHELTLSMGYDEYEGNRDILQVINNADKMMYENKVAKRKERQS